MLIPEEKIDAIFQLMKKDLIKPENRILILIYLNCDSICATKIIGTLLKQNYIQYSLKPIISLENLYQIIKEDLTEEIVSLLLINCGGQIDIIHDLNIQKDITIYICDSHLPFHENNIKDEEKILLFNSNLSSSFIQSSQSSEEISNSSSIFDNNSIDSSNNSISESSDSENEKKKKQGIYFGKPASYMMYELAYQMGIKDFDLLWLAIIGLTDQYIHNRIDEKIYNQLLHLFKDTISFQNLPHIFGFDKRIICENEYKFALYRHWNLYESMYYSSYIASRLGIWKENGRKKLNIMFVKMGLPIEECKNHWNCMNTDFKKIIKQKIHEVGMEFDLHDITYTSFYKNIGFKLQISAVDTVLALTSFLELKFEDSFFRAYDLLSFENFDLLQEALQYAIKIQQSLIKEGISIVEKQIIVRTGPFRYVFLPQTPDIHLFTNPLTITRLGLFLLDILTKIGKAKSKPLVLACLNEKNYTYIVVGIAAYPISDRKRNKFGLAFEETARKTSSRIIHHYFDSFAIEIFKDDIKKFMDYLHSKLV